LSVVIPAHNSSSIIGPTIESLVERLATRHAEILVIENGSADDTYSRALSLADHFGSESVRIVVLRSRRGMGAALAKGVAASHGASILLTADDLPFGFDDLDQWDRQSRRVALMVGSKAHPSSEIDRGFVRDLLTRGFRGLSRAVLNLKTADPQGTILGDGRLLRAIVKATREEQFLFSTELVFLAERAGYRPLEVPVTLRASHRFHASRVRPMDVFQMAVGLIRIRWRHRRTTLRLPDLEQEHQQVLR
jgi:glycosyltransferase involved in cell wall biosynthesis